MKIYNEKKQGVQEKNIKCILRPFWSTAPVSGQSSLGSEGNHQKQKVGEDETEQGDHVLSQYATDLAASAMWFWS